MKRTCFPGAVALLSAVLNVPGATGLPVITQQPHSTNVNCGAPATFTVVATGTALTYQWRTNGLAIAGATSASYTTPPVTKANNNTPFQVVVSNTSGSVTSSPPAILTVTDTTPPVITCPANITTNGNCAPGFPVIYVASATDSCDGPVPATCNPPPNFPFPVGTTPVTCVAGDSSGNTASCTFTVTVVCPGPVTPEVFFTSDSLPPTNGVYISPALFHALYANGVVIRDPKHHFFTQSLPPPATGVSQRETFGSTVEFEVSLSPTTGFIPVSAPAQVTIQVTSTGSTGSTRTFDTEMPQLDISGGGLPAGVMVRESPTLASKGKTSIRSVPGGYMISSFFDIFTELSLDGGQTWSPVAQATPVELRIDPPAIVPIPTGTALLPPPDGQYVTPAQFHAAYAAGIVIKDIRHKFFTQSLPPPAQGGSQVHSFDSQVDMQLSTDGGKTFTPARVPGAVAVLVSNVNTDSSGQNSFFDTEMTMLDLHGGDLPPLVMIRESPTEPSRGGLTIQSQPDGTFRMSSFFDIFTELSTDGGKTWQPATTGPAHVELQRASFIHPFSTQNLPPEEGQYVSPPDSHTLYANGVILSNVTHTRFSPALPAPPPGQSQVESLDWSANMKVSMDGGATFNSYWAPAKGSVLISNIVDGGSTWYYDTEILGLDIRGGTLPAGVMIRESPSKASLGRTSLSALPDPQTGEFRVSSFFDVFTELSLDGGQTWSPAISRPGPVNLVPQNPPFAPFVIHCPSDITVFNGGPSGSVVNYSLPPILFYPDCPFGPFDATCVPPSGSVFPVGTTTVNCTGHDGCGETPTCSFHVTVLQTLVPAPYWFFQQQLLPPPNGGYVSPGLSNTIYANGIMIRDVRDHLFTESAPPPIPGLPDNTIGGFSTVEFELSMDGGQTFQPVQAMADGSVRVSAKGGTGALSQFDTEMLQLDISGGTLPPGVMLRESPTLQSIGQTSVQPAPGGGYLISSFFDIFTELSLDGGQTWSPAEQPTRVELHGDPAGVAPIPVSTPVLPSPEGVYMSPPDFIGLYPAGATALGIKGVQLKFFTPSSAPPPPGGNQMQTFTAQVDMQLSLNGGQTFLPARAPAVLAVHVVNLGSSGQDGLFDAEITSLIMQGGDLPSTVMIRESPTLPSRGALFIGRNDGKVQQISSFFDVFTELSTDGGKTWQPSSTGPAHLELQTRSNPALFQTGNLLPPPTGQYITGAQAPIVFSVGTQPPILLSNVSNLRFTASVPPPAPGTSVTQQFNSVVSMLVSPNGGLNWIPVTAPASNTVRVTSLMDFGTTRFFDTEILSLSLTIQVPGLPPVMVRESPTKASLGRVSVSQNPTTGQFLIDSFFDVFTELSMDVGKTWNAAVTGPSTVGLTPSPLAPMVIDCPGNITAKASSSSGATVDYLVLIPLYPDCPFGPFTYSCSPPSGSVFPVGTTTVTCTGSDGCGEHPTCSFTVTVQKPFIYNGLILAGLGSATLAPGALASSLVVSNLGEGGQDGFRINATAADGVLVNFQPFPVDVQTCAISIARSPFDVILSVATFYGGSNPIVKADFSAVGSAQSLVQVMDENHQLVSSFLIDNNAAVSINQLFPPCPNGTSFYTIYQDYKNVWVRFCRAGCDCTGTNCYTERIVCLSGILFDPAVVAQLGSLEIRSQGVDNPSSLTVLNVQLMKFGNTHLAKGLATLDASGAGAAGGGGLTVANLGSSGQDGVGIDLTRGGVNPNGGSQFDVSLLPVTLFNQGVCWKMTAFGQFNGVANTELGNASFTEGITPGGGSQVSVDFSGIGSSLARVDIYNGASFVGSTTLPAGVLGTLFVQGEQCNLIACGKLPSPTPCFYARFDAPFVFQVSANSQFSGTEIRILAAQPAGQVQNITSFCVQACNLASFTITGEQSPQPIEIDTFDYSLAELVLTLPSGAIETVELAGPATVQVAIGPAGQATDSDNNGFDDAQTQMTQLDLQGNSSMGPVHVTLNPNQPSLGRIEETSNLVPGVLEVPPFAPGSADSFFDVFFQIQIGGPNGPTYFPSQPVRMEARISHKPPAPGENYVNPFTQPIDLLDATGARTGIRIVREIHTPNPRVEIDHMKYGSAQLTLAYPNGQSEVVSLAGPSTVRAIVPPDGAAADTDGNGRDQVPTEMTVLNLQGNSSQGPVQVTLDPAHRSLGQIEEQVNGTSGLLDVPPFCAAGAADSFFDVFPLIQVGGPNGRVFHPAKPIHMQSVIHHKPPAPGDTYINPFEQPIDLLDANGNPTGIKVIREVHTPNPTNELDTFNYSLAAVTLSVPLPTGGTKTENISLAGPTTVLVHIPPNGAASDTDGNGLDQVSTEMLSLDLMGNSSMGPVHVTLDPSRPTLGQIEERLNNTPGTLDVSPFTVGGSANSFFDVFFQIQVGGQTLYSATSVHMQSVITHKPPNPGETYVNPFTQPVQLLDANGNPTGIFMVNEQHTPNPPVELDTFQDTAAQITLQLPTGGTETVNLTGPSTVKVFIPPSGQAADTDGNGLDQVPTEMIQLDLMGFSSIGPVHVMLDPSQPSLGQIEEQVNNTPGTLDLPPFTATGSANSFFDVFFDIEIGGEVLHPAGPVHMQSVITHKPPAPGESYINPFTQPVPLLDANGNPTGVSIVREIHTPNPPPQTNELDTFDYSLAAVTLSVPLPTGGTRTENITLAGPTTVLVHIPPNGAAADTDGNGLDQVSTEMLALDLMGNSPSMGPVHITLDPTRRTFGQIEELVNRTPGTLDLPPFTLEGSANSFFDVFFQVQVAGQTYHSASSLHVQSVITHKPPNPGETYVNPFTTPVELLDAKSNHTGIFLVNEQHLPNPPVEIDVFQDSAAQITLQLPTGGTETVNLTGPSTVKVMIPPNGAAADTDGNGLDQVPTEMIQLDLFGTSSMGPVHVKLDPNQRSLGQIEEQVNNTPGTLDLPPFTATGSANSFFDVFFEIEVAGQVMRPARSVHMQSVITHKPPAPGETYVNPFTDPVPLLDANGNPTGIYIVREVHTPNPNTELDTFNYSLAAVTLSVPLPTGGTKTENITLAGPTTVLVHIPPNGAAADTDGNGLDQVSTEMLALDLMGYSMIMAAPVHVTLDPTRRTLGQIEERVNNTPGTLDVAPFTATGSANSFFDVFFQIQVGGQTLHSATSVHMQSVITHKPPNPGETYVNPFTQPVELLDANSNHTGIFLVNEQHTPNPPVEIDAFQDSAAQITLVLPTGGSETVDLSGPSTVKVFIPPSGQAADTDGNGLDQVPTEMTQLDLMGMSSMGLVRVMLDPTRPSLGQIEEQVNNTPGTLDLPPFTATGSANSFFDVFFAIEVDGQVLRPAGAVRMRSVITHKPPGPGESYFNFFEVPVQLFDANGNPTGIYIRQEVHTPNPTNEVDTFIYSLAAVTLSVPGRPEEVVNLAGPTTVLVLIPPDGAATDTDNNGLDQVSTEMLSLDLMGNSSMGPVHITLDPSFQTLGQIEERVNNTPGTLDVPPFTGTGSANSFFDVFFQIQVAGQTYHGAGPLHVQSVITHKPPNPGETYVNPFTTPVQLLDANGNPTGIFIVNEQHTPNPPVEIDVFHHTDAQVTLQLPNGGTETVNLSGPSMVKVMIPPNGQAADTDGNGLDQAPSEMIQLDLNGMSSMGPVHVKLDPTRPTLGQIEEQINNTPGTLDVPPFTATGSADSFFDVFFVIEVGGQVLRPATSVHMQSVIHHKPPAPGDTYINPFTQPVPLLDANGNPTGLYILREVHTPNPNTELDTFNYSLAAVTLSVPLPTGGTKTENITLAGPTTVLVHIPPDGAAADTDGNGLDQVSTEMLSLDLMGNSSMGPVHVTLDPSRPTLGQIEERVNNTPGTLDLPPFTLGGSANSFFDVFFQIQVGGKTFYSATSVHMQSVITHKPPNPGETYVNPFTQPVELLDVNSNHTGIFLVNEQHTPNPPVELDVFQDSAAQITLQLPTGGTETVNLDGPSTVKVMILPNGQAADTDGNGLDQVPTEMTQLDLMGMSSIGPVHVTLDPTHRSLGQIEEQVNNTPGTLDLPPFTATGSANSFFDVFFDIEVAGQVLHPAGPVHMQSVITHKPPGPGESYINPFTQPVPLLDANGNPTGVYIVREVHTPDPTNELDQFNYSLAAVTLSVPGRPNEVVNLAGPSTILVHISPDGAAADTDGNGLDQVNTEMLSLDLMGNSSMGPVHVMLDPTRRTLGQIEERVNLTPGTLDLPPFTPTGSANSFFDVFFQIQVGGLSLHPSNSVRMASVITHKPPNPGETYVDPFTQPVELYDPNGNRTGIFIVNEQHTPNPPVEIDVFQDSSAQVTLRLPNGAMEVVNLAGPSTVKVMIPPNGAAADTDGNGLDQVPTEMTQLDLVGMSSMGPVHVKLDPTRPSLGQIEEQVNNTPGTLDVPPFTATGSANSFFDVFFEMEVAGQVMRPARSVHMQSVITHKPPAPGETYVNPFTDPVPLLDANGNPTGIYIVREVHTPNPNTELDTFNYSLAAVTLSVPLPTGGTKTENITLAGPTTVLVHIPPNGAAADTDGNGLDQVSTEMLALDLMGNSSMGPVHVTLDPNRRTLGQIEERVNNTPGTLDVPPFTATGSANSFFDVFFQIQVGGQTLHSATSVHMQSVITHKPPNPGETYVNPFTQPVELLDANSNHTGIFLVNEQHTPNPPVEIDAFQDSAAQITLVLPTGGSETVDLSGPSTVKVFIPPNGAAADTDGNGLDQVPTEMTQLDLMGMSSMGLVHVMLDPNHPSLGQIEEQKNNTPGTLDLPPFTPTGSANSFFDVFFDIEVNGQVLHPAGPVHMQSVITHKPPAPGESYINPFTHPVPLLDANGNPTGVYIVREVHTPNPTSELDTFNYSLAAVTLSVPLPTGGTKTENITLAGPTTVLVHVPPTGATTQTDGLGHDQVSTEMLSLDLMGNSSMGPVRVTLDPARPTLGTIVETANNTPGILDVPPFTATGSATSSFDVFFQIQVGAQTFYSATSVHMQSVITHKPPNPGETYVNPFTQPVQLLDANGNPTGIFLVNEQHTPNPKVEIDVFQNSQAQITLQLPDGGTELVNLSGPSTVKVMIPPNGQAADTDGNGLDQVPTEMTQLDLTGSSSMGPVLVTLDPTQPSLGQIEERVNNTPGTLDLPPFTATGSANSFFDVFFEIQVGAQVLHPARSVHMQSIITHKPPAPGETYFNPFTQPVPLLDANGDPTGIYIVREVHTPTPTNELDTFDYSLAAVTLSVPGRPNEVVNLAGPTTVLVHILPGGATTETDGQGHDQASTEMLSLDLHGSSSIGPVHVMLDPTKRTLGKIVEQVNNTAGILDLPPFTATGSANSFFDVFFQIEVGGLVLHPSNSVHLASVITHKPPGPGETYVNPFTTPVELLDPKSNHTGIFIVNEQHTPTPPVEIDHFPNSQADITVQLPNGATEVVHVSGPTTVQVSIPSNGQAADTDGNGRDQVPTEMTQLGLTGTSSLGPVQVMLDPTRPSLGQIEEQVNNTPGTLDLPPFTATGSADSFFDVFFEIQIGGMVLHNGQPVHMHSVIHHKPPAPGDTYINPFTEPVDLLDANGNPTGLRIVREVHVPVPVNCPGIICPSNIVVSTCSPNGQLVQFAVAGTNACGGTVTPSCIPASGSTFPIGTTTVICTATDSAGNSAKCSFTVTVQGDTQPPQITCPANIVVNTDSGQCSKSNVTYTAGATDNCPGVKASCAPPSGSTFTKGVTPVACTAADASGNTSRCTFTVTVNDTEAPKLACPTGQTIRTCTDLGQAFFSATATDNCDATVAVTCSPPSGSFLPAGNTVVLCQAADSSGNKASCQFTVTVVPEPKPKMTVTILPGGQLQMCWTTPCPGYHIQCVSGLEPSLMWQNVTNTVVTNGTTYCVTVSLQGGRRFYRLVANPPQEVFSPTNSLPPVGSYISPSREETVFANGLIARWFVHGVPPTNPPVIPCPTCPDPIILSFLTTVDFQYSTDGGKTFQNANASNVPTRVQVHGSVSGQNGPVGTLSTELLQMDISGGTLPSGVMVRESPTKASLGQHTERCLYEVAINGSVDGPYMISSFFDVFLEVSVDTGKTWFPSLTPVHVDYVSPAPPNSYSSDNFPLVGTYYSLSNVLTHYVNGLIARNFKHQVPPPPSQLPPPCPTCPPEVFTFPTVLDFEYSTDGGQTFNPAHVPGVVSTVVADYYLDTAQSWFFSTELLSLGTVKLGPPGVMLRESPTLSSTGKTLVERAPTGGFRISSFFDVFTEVSLDGGQTWSGSINPTHLELNPQPLPP